MTFRIFSILSLVMFAFFAIAQWIFHTKPRHHGEDSQTEALLEDSQCPDEHVYEYEVSFEYEFDGLRMIIQKS